MSEKNPKENLSIYRPTLLKERIAGLESEIARLREALETLAIECPNTWVEKVALEALQESSNDSNG
jgi:hypothetical protein